MWVNTFLSDPAIPGVRSMGPSLCPSLTNWCLVDLTDVTLVDEDTNSILADDTNRTIPGNLAIQMRQSYLVRKVILWEKVVSWEKVILWEKFI